ncbi:class C sortase [Dubosiella newyorkensis]|uniref:class C sortase n=1 Tax=Dubosiella newyorkensis TaxID=1862672 RepID=UPI00258E177D|nr:class C sortase [Dubosiella newyorkensis]
MASESGSHGVATKKNNNTKRKPDWLDRLSIWMLLVGIGLIAYPTAADWWNSIHQTHMLTEYGQMVEDIDRPIKHEMLMQARTYNQTLVDKEDRWNLTNTENETYNHLLDPGKIGIMGSISIPSLGITYPIYHGTSEGVLAVAIGHMPGSSLPTGGKGVHTILSGHRGLPSAQLFTHLDRLKKGDHFQIETLDQKMLYEVDQIKTVLPGDDTYVQIDPNADLCTLVTCTPFEVNTHRLLVRGHRIPLVDTSEPYAIPWPRIFLCIGLLIMLIGQIVSKRREQK